MKMLGDLAIRCEYGCCRVYGRNGHKAERRHIKRSERNKINRELRLFRT